MTDRKTRSTTDHFLIGSEEPCIRAGTKLLTGKSMMQYLMFRKNLPENKTATLASVVCCPMCSGTKVAKCQTEDSEGCEGVGLCVVASVKHDGNWVKSGIPLVSDFAIRDKIINKHKFYRENIMKFKNSSSKKAIEHRENFLKKFRQYC